MSIKLTNVIDYMIKQDKLVTNLENKIRKLELENNSLRIKLGYDPVKSDVYLKPDELNHLESNMIDKNRESNLRKYAIDQLYDESICEWKLFLSGSLDDNGKVVYDETEEEFFRNSLVNTSPYFSMNDLKLLLKDKLHETYLKYCNDVTNKLLLENELNKLLEDTDNDSEDKVDDPDDEVNEVVDKDNDADDEVDEADDVYKSENDEIKLDESPF